MFYLRIRTSSILAAGSALAQPGWLCYNSEATATLLLEVGFATTKDGRGTMGTTASNESLRCSSCAYKKDEAISHAQYTMVVGRLLLLSERVERIAMTVKVLEDCFFFSKQFDKNRNDEEKINYRLH